MAEKTVSEDQIKVLEKLQKIKKSQWKEMRPMFDQLYEIAQEGGVSDFLKETFDTFYETMMTAMLLPFLPLIEVFTPEIIKLFEETLPDFITEMEEVAKIVRDTLGIEIGGLTIGEILANIAGFATYILTGKFQKDMMEWGQNFAKDVADAIIDALGGPAPVEYETWITETPEWFQEWQKDGEPGSPSRPGGPRRVPF